MSSKGIPAKNCKHCMTKIAKRASICPQCRSDLSALGGIKSFFQTGAWVLTTLVSLGFAAHEKVEKMGFETKLEEKTSELIMSNLVGESWKALLTQPYEEPPLEFAADGKFKTEEAEPEPLSWEPTPDGNPGDERISAIKSMRSVEKKMPEYDAAEVLRIEKQLDEEMAKVPRNLDFIKRLVKRKQYLLLLKARNPG